MWNPLAPSGFLGTLLRLMTVTQKSAPAAARVRSVIYVTSRLNIWECWSRAALQMLRKFQLLQSLASFLLNVFSASVFFTLGTIQHLIYAPMTSCVTQNFSGGNPNTTIHKTATKSLNPSFQNNARASLWARCFGISYVWGIEYFWNCLRKLHSIGTFWTSLNTNTNWHTPF